MYWNNNDDTIKETYLYSGLKERHEPKSGNKIRHAESNNPDNKQKLRCAVRSSDLVIGDQFSCL